MKRSSMTGVALAILLVSLVPSVSEGAELHPAYHDRAEQATVQLSFIIRVLEHGVEIERQFWPNGSATIVQREGVLLSNFHVVDPRSIQPEIDNVNRDSASKNLPRVLELASDSMLVSMTRDDRLEAGYTASVIATDEALDLAVLHIVGNADGVPLNVELDLQFLELGDSDGLRGTSADIYLFGYPEDAAGIRWTNGIVSGFDGEEWIDSDATASPGYSGGAAIDANGNLVAIPTEITSPARGGALVKLRPINLAKPLLDSEFNEPPAVAPLYGPVSGTLEIMPQNPTELRGENNWVEVASNRDLLATFEVVNPLSVQFPQLWSLLVWIVDGNQAPCIYMLTSVGIGFYGTGVPAEADMVLEQFEASTHLTAPGAINLIGVRVLDGNSWLSVNGEELGPYPCQTWSGTGWIGVGATSDLDTSLGKVEFNQFTVWAPDE